MALRVRSATSVNRGRCPFERYEMEHVAFQEGRERYRARHPEAALAVHHERQREALAGERTSAARSAARYHLARTTSRIVSANAQGSTGFNSFRMKGASDKRGSSLSAKPLRAMTGIGRATLCT